MSYPKDHAVLDYAVPILGACAIALCLAMAMGDPVPPPVQAVTVELPPLEPERLVVASWYGEPYHGRRTASGEVFDQDALTAAHPSLPFGTLLRCTLGARSVIVRVTDRGPFHPERDLDLSRAAAAQLGMLEAGVAILSVREVQ